MRLKGMEDLVAFNARKVKRVPAEEIEIERKDNKENRKK